MKRSISAIFLVLFSAVYLNAQAAPDAAVLTKLLNEFLDGAGRNDAAVHDRFWADDLIYTRSAGVRITKEELMKGVRSAPPAKPGDPVSVYTAEDIRIQQYDTAAVVAFRLVSTTTKADGTKTVGNNLNTGTFIKRGGKWQVVAWQSTVVPKSEPAAAAETKPAAAAPVGLVNGPVTASVAPTAPPQAASTTSGGKTYQKGPRGGCYYLNDKGAKVYVDKKYCP